MDKDQRSLFRNTIICYGIAGLLLVASWIMYELHQWSAGIALGLAGGLFLVLGYLLSNVVQRLTGDRLGKLSHMMQSIETIPAWEEDYPWLDREKLAQWTSEFEALGFAEPAGYTVGIGGVTVEGFKGAESFTRVMANPEKRCFAEISQSLHPKNGLKAMVCSCVTLFTSGQWCQTSNGDRIPQPASQILRDATPQLVTFQEPGATPAELLRLHIEQRDRLAADKRLTVLEDTSQETYRQETAKTTNRMMGWMQSKLHD